MKFNICRTSVHDEKPCANASKIETLRKDGMSIVWVINTIKTLDDLVEFTRIHGPIIVSDKEIEIYDNYRE